MKNVTEVEGKVKSKEQSSDDKEFSVINIEFKELDLKKSNLRIIQFLNTVN